MNHKRQGATFLVGLSFALAACATTPQPPAEPIATSTPTTPLETLSQSVESLTRAGAPTILTTGLTTPWSIVSLDDTALIGGRNDGVILELLPDGDSSRGSFKLGIAETILDGLPSASYHDGGRIAFGPDGMLTATVGDAGNRSSAQDPNSLGGKILRMTPDGEAPDDNPFPGSVVYSYGHRNPQGIAWSANGTFYSAELGQDAWDELNIITPGSNYGWPDVEGISGDPVQQWGPGEASPGGITIIGGTIFIANLRGEVLRTVPVAGPSTSTALYRGEYSRIRDVATVPDGSLWLITTNTDNKGTPGAEDHRLISVQLTE